ncbi:hypothetical protein U1Q18_047929 [Sarracenia purpurea var. burkii]
MCSNHLSLTQEDICPELQVEVNAKDLTKLRAPCQRALISKLLERSIGFKTPTNESPSWGTWGPSLRWWTYKKNTFAFDLPDSKKLSCSSGWTLGYSRSLPHGAKMEVGFPS